MSVEDGGRRRAERFGRHAETACRLLLLLKGYRILATRLRTPMGEIDIVARRGDELAVVEVKGRRDWETAAEAVTARQRARLARAANAFLSANPHLAGLPLRFDVMLVTPWAFPRHIIDAWRLS
jgi:putative endonuclease